jgi:hypothetical protein
VRGRGCLVAVAVTLAVAGALAALFGPGLLGRARGIYAPISKMKGEQREFEAWVSQRGWREPARPALDPATLDSFLALRRELVDLDDRGASLRRRTPRGPGARLENVPAIVEGVGGLVGERLAAFRRHGLTPAQYEYVERLAYVTWLPLLVASGEDPAARERAAHEVEAAAGREPMGPVRARLRQVAEEIRQRVPPAPAGVPEDVHRLLLSRAAQIEAQPATRIPTRVARPREDRRPETATSP